MERNRLRISISDSLQALKLQPLQRLGSGVTAQVYLVKDTNGNVFAAKCMQRHKDKELISRAYKQYSALKDLSHPNIVKCHNMLESKDHYVLVFENCEEGSLQQFQSTLQLKRFTLRQTREALTQLLRALSKIHGCGYVHRDIKPQNILLRREAENKIVFKIADFGFTKAFPQGIQTTATLCGTYNYMAPQILLGKKYDKAVDCWSVGVVTYSMLFGMLPFTSMDLLSEMRAKCQSSGFDLRSNLSAVGQLDLLDSLGTHYDVVASFFRRIFVIDPSARMTVEQAMNHPLLQRKPSLAISSSKVTDSSPTSSIETNQSDSPKAHKYSPQHELDLEAERILFLRATLEILEDSSIADTFQDWEHIALRYFLSLAVFLRSKHIIGKISEASKELVNFQRLKSSMTLVKKQAENSLSILSGKLRNTQHYLACVRQQVKGFKEQLLVDASDFSFDFQYIRHPYRSILNQAFYKVSKCSEERVRNIHALRLRLFCCHQISKVFEASQVRNYFEAYSVRQSKGSKGAAILFSHQEFEKWLQAGDKQEIVKVLEDLYHKFLRGKEL